MAKKRKLEKPLLFSTYRDRSSVYGEGNNSGNDVCNFGNSPDEEYITPSLCYICATTRGDPLLRPVSNKLGAGREYYLEYCGNPYEEQGTTGYVSRSPALYGLYLHKVNMFYEAHEDHVFDNRQWIETEGKFPIYHPAILHVQFWGDDLEYTQQITDLASTFMTIQDQQVEQGNLQAPKDYNTQQKTILQTILEYLKTKPNWDMRKEAIERYTEEANKIGSYKTDPILPIQQSFEIQEDTNLDDFFDPFSTTSDIFGTTTEEEETDIPF